MKQNQIKDSNIKVLGSYNYENIFNVYKDEGGKYFYNLHRNLSFPKEIQSNYLYTLFPIHNELLPQLSYRIYGVVNLWWVIAGLNNIQNPLEPLNAEIPLTILTNPAIKIILTEIGVQ